MDWRASPQISYVEVLTLCTVEYDCAGDKVLKEVIQVKWAHVGGSYSIMTGVFIGGETHWDCVGTDERSYEDRGRMWYVQAQEVGRSGTNPTGTFILDFQLSELWENTFVF